MSEPAAPMPATSDGVAQPSYIATMMTPMSTRNGRKRGSDSNRSRHVKCSSSRIAEVCPDFRTSSSAARRSSRYLNTTQAANSSVSMMPGPRPARNRRADRLLGREAVEDQRQRRRDQDAERAARGDQPGREPLRIAALQQLRDAGRADRRARGRRRSAHRGEHRAREHVGEPETAGDLVQPRVERPVDVGAGARLADRRAHQHEQRDRQQREVVELRVHRLGDRPQIGRRHEDRHERERRQAERERDRHAREQQHERDGAVEEADLPGAHHSVHGAFCASSCASSSARWLRRLSTICTQLLQRERRHADRHEQVRNPQLRRPRAVGHPAVAPRLVEEVPRIGGDEPAEDERQHVADEVAHPVHARRQQVLEHLDRHVAALQLRVRGAHERRDDQEDHAHLDLPIRRPLEDVANHDLEHDDEAARDDHDPRQVAGDRVEPFEAAHHAQPRARRGGRLRHPAGVRRDAVRPVATLTSPPAPCRAAAGRSSRWPRSPCTRCPSRSPAT